MGKMTLVAACPHHKYFPSFGITSGGWNKLQSGIAGRLKVRIDVHWHIWGREGGGSQGN